MVASTVPSLRPNVDALREFQDRGYVIFDAALPPALLRSLREDYAAALAAKQQLLGIARSNVDRGKGDRYGRPNFLPLGGNHDVNRWNMHLPSRMPFLDPAVIANPLAMPIIDAVMGPDCVLAMLASDAASPGSQLQEIHQDSLSTRLVVNIPLVDASVENGAIELWPGTHRRDPLAPTGPFEYDVPPIDPTRIKEIVAKVPSTRGVMRAGSLLVRDQRLLHRGTENGTQEVRPMLSLLYFADADELPHRRITDVAAYLALGARRLARSMPKGVRQAKAVSRANAAGRIVEFSARTDRDYRRVIPRDIWTTLPETARRLLRHARVEGAPVQAERESWRATRRMLKAALSGFSAHVGGKTSAPRD